MLIDWFTVGAQTLNFLILVWLMKRYLYKPIRLAIDTREKRIAAELADAAAKQVEAQKQRDEFQHKNEEFDQQRSALMTKATETADAEGRRLLDQATKEADALGVKRRESAQSEVLALHQAIGRRTQQEVFSIARKVLADLATTSLEESACAEFIRRVRALDGGDKATLVSALKSASAPAVVRSAFDLATAQREGILRVLRETFAADLEVRFESAPDLIGGIELTASGQKVGWSIADYLAALEGRVVAMALAQDKPDAKSAQPSMPKQDAGHAAAKPVAQQS